MYDPLLLSLSPAERTAAIALLPVMAGAALAQLFTRYALARLLASDVGINWRALSVRYDAERAHVRAVRAIGLGPSIIGGLIGLGLALGGVRPSSLLSWVGVAGLLQYSLPSIEDMSVRTARGESWAFREYLDRLQDPEDPHTLTRTGFAILALSVATVLLSAALLEGRLSSAVARIGVGISVAALVAGLEASRRDQSPS